MRALCGAIITAGALIGLGLTAIGYGLRYAPVLKDVNTDTGHIYGATSLMVIEVALLLALAVGLGIAFMGLAYHHYRRHQELQRLHGGALTPGSITTPRTTV
ncbi:MAG TPA: hypothetical protein VFE78_09490 [Gemmataceae bacterium]|jgi:hypothetical protein|nr:hypothetical protein [Gemmataceae bacterium]